MNEHERVLQMEHLLAAKRARRAVEKLAEGGDKIGHSWIAGPGANIFDGFIGLQ